MKKTMLINRILLSSSCLFLSPSLWGAVPVDLHQTRTENGSRRQLMQVQSMGLEDTERHVFEDMATKNPHQNDYLLIQLKPLFIHYKQETLEAQNYSSTQIERWILNFKLFPQVEKHKRLAEMMAVICRGVELVHKYYPRATQVCSVLSFLTNNPDQGRLLQVQTGEGKTLITAMTAAAKALMGYKVDILTSSEVLAEKDYNEQASFYKQMMLAVGILKEEVDSTKLQTYDIFYGSPAQFEAAGLREDLNCWDFEKRALLIDEVDSILIDQLCSRTLLSEPIDGMEQILPLFTFMYTSLQGIIQDESLLNLNKLSITNKLQKLTTLALEGKLDGVKFSIPSHLKAYVRMYLPIWSQTAYDAFYEQEDVSFINTEGGGILPVDHAHTGMVHTNQVYNRALHQFLEIKHLKTLRPENLAARYTSHVSYISKYGKRIYGLTGTLGDDTTRRFLSNSFSIDCIEVPTYAPKQFKEDAPTFLSSAEEWQSAIFGVVQQTILQERVGLFLFETIQQLKEFEAVLIQHDIKYIRYNRNDLNDKIPEKVEAGTIILSTNLGGRGTDIKLSHEVIKKGGLHVCLTFLPFNERVEAQNFGRASRQGQPGTGGLVLNQHDIINRSLLFENEPPNIATIRERRRERVYKDLLDKFLIDAPRLQVEDGLFVKVSQLVKHLRGGGKNKEAAYTLKEAYLDSIMSELWGLQFGLMSGYKERTEAESLRLLTQHASALELTIGNSEEVKANHFTMLFAQELKISYDTLKADLLSYTLEISRKTKQSLEETFKSYMGDSEELLKALCQLTETTLVIINPKGTFQIFKGGDRHRIILGRVRSDTNTSFSLHGAQDLELFDTPEDDSLIHALAHQMKLNNITLPAKPIAKVSYKELKSYLSFNSGSAPPPEDVIKTFVQKTGCIVAVAEEKEINAGFTYYLCQGDVLIRETHQSLPEKWAINKVLYLVQNKRVREGNKFEKEEDVVIPHFQSVISVANNAKPASQGTSSVFEVLPAYKHTAVKLRRVPPVQGMPKYSILRGTTDHLHEIITRKIECAPLLEKIPPQRRVEHASINLLAVNEPYEKALARYHQDLLAQEYVAIDSVVSNFIESSKVLYESGDIILPPSKLNRLVTADAENLDEAFYQTLGAFPSLSHVTYYIQARYEVNRRRNGYLNRAKSMLLSAKEMLIQGMQPWQLVHGYMNHDNAIDSQSGNAASESLLSKQIAGRMGFYQGLHHNIINNIEFIKNHKEGDVRCSNEFSRFQELGVSKLDEDILRGVGISAFYDIEKIPPEPTFGDLLGMAILGAAQAVGGVLLICTGAGVSIGVTLLTEGLQDAYQAIKSGLTREAIDWAGYWVNKGFSLCMCVASAAYGAAKETIGQGFKGFGASFKQGFLGATKEVTQKGIQEAAKKAITETVIRTTAQALANEGMSALIQSIIQTLKKDIEEASQAAISSLKKDECFMQKMYQIQAFEAAIENSTQVSVLRKIEHNMQSWLHSNDNIRTSLLVIKKVAEFLRNQHQTGWSKTLSVSAQLAALGYSAHTALTFGNDYVQKFREEVLAAKIPSMENVLTLLTDDKNNSIRWVKKAQEAGLMGTTSPYESRSKDLKERLVSVDMANLLNYQIKLSDADYIQTPSLQKVTMLGKKILINICSYYERQSKARVDFIERNLANLWLNDCSQGIVKEFREQAMSAVSGLISIAAKNISNEIFISGTLRVLERKESRGGTLSSDERDQLAWARREDTKLKVQEIESIISTTDDTELKKYYQAKADSLNADISRSYSEEAARIIPGEREAFLQAHGTSAETLVKKLDEKLKSLEDEGTNPHIIGLWKHLQQQARASDCTELINKRVQRIPLNADEKGRYEAYLRDESMKDFRGRTEIALRKADAEHAAAEGRAKDAAAEAARRDQRDAGPDKSKHRDPEPGTLPAVASAKAPEGVDSSAAVETLLQQEQVKAGLAGMFTPEQLQEVVDVAKEAKRVKVREDSIAQIDAARHLTEGEKQELRDMYDGKTFGTQVAGGIIDIGAKIADDVTVFQAEHEASKDRVLPERGTAGSVLADVVLSPYTAELTTAVAAGSVYSHGLAPVVNTVIGAGVEVLKLCVKGAEMRDVAMAQAGAQLSGIAMPTETPKEVMERVDGAFKATGEAVQTVMKPVVETVQSSIEMATGSKRAGEVLAEPVLMLATDGAFRLAKPALTAAKTSLQTAAHAVRNLEVTVDSAAFLRHNTGVPFDAIKIGQKAPKVEVPTSAAPAAPKVAEAAVSQAPSNVIRKSVKVVTASGETVVQQRIVGLNGELFERHHILSDKNKLIVDHPLLKEIGYDLQEHQMYLPTKEGGEVSTTFRTIHDGKHVDKYSRELAAELDRIRDVGRQKGYTREQFVRAVDDLVKETRIQLKDGEIHLNKNTRESLGLPLKGEPQ